MAFDDGHLDNSFSPTVHYGTGSISGVPTLSKGGGGGGSGNARRRRRRKKCGLAVIIISSFWPCRVCKKRGRENCSRTLSPFLPNFPLFLPPSASCGTIRGGGGLSVADGRKLRSAISIAT